jgi:hypothetical protein
MKPSGRFGLVGWQKAVLWIAFILCIWRFLQVPAIFDALLKFYAAGEIPGTDVVLSPDAALWFVFITSSVGALVLFLRLFVFRRSDAYVLQHAHNEPQPVVSLKPVAEPQPVVAAKPSKPKRIGPSPLAAMAGRVRTGIAHGVTAVLAYARPRLAVAGRALRRIAAALYRLGKKYGLRAAAFVALLLVTIWDWAKPHIHRFDTWLEVRLNQNEITSTVIDAGRRGMSLASDLWHRAAEHAEHRPHSKER